MAQRFKPGDRVVCINPANNLAQGETYIVEGYNGPLMKLKDNHLTFYDTRFELVTPKQEKTNVTTTTTEPQTFGEITVLDGVPVRGTGRNRYVVAQPFGNELIVDIRARSSTSPDTHAFLDKLIAGAKSVRYVDNLTSFFDPKARYAAFVKSGYTDTQGVDLSQTELDALKLLAGIKEKFEKAFAVSSATPPKAPYIRVALPNGVTDPLRRIKFLKTSLKRNEYYLSNNQAKRVWEKARELWRNGQTEHFSINVRANSSDYRLRVYANTIEIGCQTIQRYELEAIAEKMGWEF